LLISGKGLTTLLAATEVSLAISSEWRFATSAASPFIRASTFVSV
jgi:hypothetical protein